VAQGGGDGDAGQCEGADAGGVGGLRDGGARLLGGQLARPGGAGHLLHGLDLRGEFGYKTAITTRTSSLGQQMSISRLSEESSLCR